MFIKSRILMLTLVCFFLNTKAQDETINGNLSVTRNINASKILLNAPNAIDNWNSIWQSGFFESLDAANSPEPSGWFWGVNFNHRHNHPKYRYNGQIAIRNSSSAPTMYFRSTDKDGNGIWTKVLHSKGQQTIEGTALINNPKAIDNWNSIWQSGFFESLDAANSPEPSGWFWGVNFNHRHNHPEYRYNGQIAIRNSSSAPTMYFRSTDKDGNGIWTKVLHNKGNQTISGNFAVVGKIESKEIVVTKTPTADFVFKSDYELPSLDFVEKHIKENKHLPEIASAKEMKQNGVNVAKFQIKLLQKIEELTLYTIAQNKEIQSQKEKIVLLKEQNSRIETLEKENKILKSLLERVHKLEEEIKEKN